MNVATRSASMLAFAARTGIWLRLSFVRKQQVPCRERQKEKQRRKQIPCWNDGKKDDMQNLR